MRRRFRGVDRRLRGTGIGKRIERKIATTGLDLTPGEYLVYVIGALLAIYFTVGAIFAPFFGVLAAFVGLWGANAFLNWQRAKRTEAFINQLPEFTRVLANATHAGLAMRTALAMAAEELDDPAGEELLRVADQLSVGHSSTSPSANSPTVCRPANSSSSSPRSSSPTGPAARSSPRCAT